MIKHALDYQVKGLAFFDRNIRTQKQIYDKVKISK